MSESSAPHLKRVLSVWDLVFYGIVLITPVAPVGVFGIASSMSKGHVTTTIVIAMVAMTLTAWSYGRMAAVYPSAGSAYVYVSGGLNPHLGFLAGWAMFLDYLIIPVVNIIYVSLTAQRLFPLVPFVVWAALVTIAVTLLNLRSIRFTARANETMLAVMFLVIGAFFIAAVRYLFQRSGWNGLLSVEPFYNPATFHLRDVATATSLAALTYIGFDGVTTLAEETRNPRRTVPLATVLVCVVTGVLSAAQVYLAQRLWPDYSTFKNLETAFLDVAALAGGQWLFQALAVVMIVSCFGSGLTGQASSARLLYGMGRDKVLPGRLLAYVEPKTGIPQFNVVLLGLLAFAGAMLLSWERAAALLNFGAFLAFMGVNAAALRRIVAERKTAGMKTWLSGLASLAGFVFCLVIWLSLPVPAKIAGGVWLLAGLIYAAIRTHGFRLPPQPVDFC
jgi:amino acid transporter